MGGLNSDSRRQRRDFVNDEGRPRCVLKVPSETSSPTPVLVSNAPAVPAEPSVPLAQGSSAAVSIPDAAPAYEQPLLELLTTPIRSGIPIKQAHGERHAQIRSFLANLSVVDARALLRRLSTPGVSDDLLVANFRKLTHDRQQNHLTFLADARVRAALAMNRRR